MFKNTFVVDKQNYFRLFKYRQTEKKMHSVFPMKMFSHYSPRCSFRSQSLNASSKKITRTKMPGIIFIQQAMVDNLMEYFSEMIKLFTRSICANTNLWLRVIQNSSKSSRNINSEPVNAGKKLTDSSHSPNKFSSILDFLSVEVLLNTSFCH